MRDPLRSLLPWMFLALLICLIYYVFLNIANILYAASTPIVKLIGG